MDESQLEVAAAALGGVALIAVAYFFSVNSTPPPSTMSKPSKNIVIIGASIAGLKVASGLAAKLPATHRIILIDPAKLAYWPIASLRASVVPGWESKVFREISTETIFAGKMAGKGQLVSAKVTKVKSNSVVIDGEFEGSSTIPFDTLIFATGSSQTFPMRPNEGSTKASILEDFAAHQKAVAEAQSIFIAGGGPTGMEFAGEVLAQHPGKKITLIHRNPTLLDKRFYPKLAVTLEAKLKAKGVTLLLGDEYIPPHGGLKLGKQDGMTTIKTAKGKKVEADFIFGAFGNTPNTSLMVDADPSAVGANKLISVNKFLQVQSKYFEEPSKVFAAGDCADSDGWRSIMATDADCAAVVTNVLAVLSGSATKPRVAGPRALSVPLGPTDGATFASVPIMGDVLMPGMMTPMIKGKTLFISMFEQLFVKA